MDIRQNARVDGRVDPPVHACAVRGCGDNEPSVGTGPDGDPGAVLVHDVEKLQRLDRLTLTPEPMSMKREPLLSDEAIVRLALKHHL